MLVPSVYYFVEVLAIEMIEELVELKTGSPNHIILFRALVRVDS